MDEVKTLEWAVAIIVAATVGAATWVFAEGVSAKRRRRKKR